MTDGTNATNSPATGSNVVRAEDLMPVRSRVSWGAIFAGAVLALSLAFLFSLLGGAVGLSVRDRFDNSSLGTAAAVWAVISTVLALFIGGWATTKLAVGENQTEAGIHGLLLWGATFALLLGLMGMGVNSGFAALAGMAGVNRMAGEAGNPAARMTADNNWEQRAREAGVPDDQIARIKERSNEAIRNTAAVAADPNLLDHASDRLTRASWYTFLGTMLSMVAAVGGAFVGSGPTYRIVAFPVARRTVTSETRMPVRS
jgi:hypothetical protein